MGYRPNKGNSSFGTHSPETLGPYNLSSSACARRTWAEMMSCDPKGG